MLRLFVGIGLPPELKLRLSLLCSGVPGAKWVDPGNFHVTLRFIGEVDEGRAADIDEALAQIRAPGFELALSSVGSFGSASKARMLWAGVEKSPSLLHLHQKVESALMRMGMQPEERRYTPHVTLARLKYAPEGGTGRLQAFLAEHALFKAPPFAVDRFSLIASYLTKSGPIYEDEAEYPLG
jgi:RNA 2',3'-cyclic 3'-phosphodiesterase